MCFVWLLQMVYRDVASAACVQMTRKCTSCNRAVTAEARYCDWCGSQVCALYTSTVHFTLDKSSLSVVELLLLSFTLSISVEVVSRCIHTGRGGERGAVWIIIICCHFLCGAMLHRVLSERPFMQGSEKWKSAWKNFCEYFSVLTKKELSYYKKVCKAQDSISVGCIYTTWGQGTTFPLFFPCPFTSSSFALFLLFLFPFLICFTYFFLLSTPFLSTRIVPLRFHAGGRRRRPNLGLVCFVYYCVICIA